MVEERKFTDEEAKTGADENVLRENSTIGQRGEAASPAEEEGKDKQQDKEVTDELGTALQEEKARLFSNYQRLQADFDNYRKRVKGEKREWSAQAVCDLIRALLPVIDNMERALDAATREGAPDTILKGLDMVYKELLAVLEKHGVCAIEALGREFDPHLHHAVMHVECDEQENTVVEELQKGYLLKDRVLRASMVKVAK